MKNILIIGGSYFAGRILVEELLQRKNYNIYLYNRGNRPFNRDDVTELVGDRNDEQRIKEVIPDRDWDALIDFCADTPDHIEKMIRAVPGNIGHYIFISTTTVNENVLDLPIKEDAPKLAGIQPELGQYADYGYNKWLSECKLKIECGKNGIPYTSLRPAIIFGEYNYAPRETYFFDLIRDNKRIFLPDNELGLFSFVWVVDLAKIIEKCIENEKVFNQAFNVAGEELVSYKRLMEVFEEVCGKNIKTSKMSIELINKKGIPLPFPLDSHLVYSGRKIEKTLGFEYTPFVAGMKKTYEYYQLVQQAQSQ
ncbi:MAG: NAD-dependent epimerase/dehydratase family protein [Deltaproteobacteria bacterium]|nr:NAD-dependent epimerase/dehydratase family protein [Deltaproteobacteria bacterium]